MKNLFRVVTVVATLSLVIGATLIFGMTASATDVTVWTGTINQDFTTKNTVAIIAVDELTQAIRDDIDANGPATKYVVNAVANFVDGPDGYSVFGFYQETPTYVEVWADKGSTYENTTFTKVEDLAKLGNKVNFCLYSDGNNDVTHVDSITIIATHEGTVTSTPTSSTASEPDSTPDSTPESTPTSSVVSTPTSSVVSTPVSSEVSTVSNPNVTLGDVNHDGSVDMKDILAVRKNIAGMAVSPFDSAAADYNNDGSIDMKDILAIRKKIAGL